MNVGVRNMRKGLTALVSSGAMLLGGCGIGAYSKDPRAGLVINEVTRGLWDAVLAKEGRSTNTTNVDISGNTNQSKRPHWDGMPNIRYKNVVYDGDDGSLSLYDKGIQFVGNGKNDSWCSIPYRCIVDVETYGLFLREGLKVHTSEGGFEFSFLRNTAKMVADNIKKEVIAINTK